MKTTISNDNNSSSINSNLTDTNDNTEQLIFNTFKGSKTSDKDTKIILAALGKIDWKKYDQISQGKAFELTDWLYVAKFENENDIISLLNATKNLDGAISEGYCGILAKIYAEDNIKFIKCLTRIEASKVKNICSYLAYGCSSNNEKFKRILSDTKKLLDSNQLNAKEKELTKHIIEAFEY